MSVCTDIRMTDANTDQNVTDFVDRNGGSALDTGCVHLNTFES
jgi:hypothetical protein